MDSNFTNTINFLCSNLKKYENKINKSVKIFNKELNFIQDEINILNNLNLNQIALIIFRNNNFFYTKEALKINLGLDIYNAVVYWVENIPDINEKAEELIQNGKKYIVVTISESVEALTKPINLLQKYLPEYPNIQFISNQSTQTDFSGILNLKKLLPDNSYFAKGFIENCYNDYFILNDAFSLRKLTLIGFYDAKSFYSFNLKEQIDIQNQNQLNLPIFWFDFNDFIEKNPVIIQDWKNLMNNINYYFNFLWVLDDITFLNDYIDIYNIKYYLYKAYFADGLLNHKLDEYLLYPFNNILSKSYFFYIKTEYFSLYKLFQDIISSIRFNDQYQSQDIYYNSSIKFNDPIPQILNNINSYILYYSKNVFRDLTPENEFEKYYTNFIDNISENNFKYFIRLDKELQFLLIPQFIQIKNNYNSISINQKVNFNQKIIFKFKNIEYDFNFNGYFIQNPRTFTTVD
jgi:hypothetical protein